MIQLIEPFRHLGSLLWILTQKQFHTKAGTFQPACHIDTRSQNKTYGGTINIPACQACNIKQGLQAHTLGDGHSF